MKLLQVTSVAFILPLLAACTITAGPTTNSFETTNPIGKEAYAKGEVRIGERIVVEKTKFCFFGLTDPFTDFTLDREKILDKAMKAQTPDCIGMRNGTLEAGIRVFLLDLIAYKWYKYEGEPVYLIENGKAPSAE